MHKIALMVVCKGLRVGTSATNANQDVRGWIGSYLAGTTPEVSLNVFKSICC